ncbi:MAG: acyl-CoA dehydrogenase family protein [Actinobacteria bacterium]|nr:acyl-CoA dehydrogenase family protein [Actinomycetota bacterium]
MTYELTEEQEAFRGVVADFVRREIAPVANEWERMGREPVEIVDKMREMGLFGMLVPGNYGGLDVDAVSYGLAFEEISRAWMGIAGTLGSHSLACLLIARFGTSEQRDRYLPRMATGEWRSGIALTEPGAGTDLQGIRTRASRDSDGYRVRGTKMWITNARHAAVLPVLVVTDPDAEPRHRGLSMLLMDADTFEVGRDLGKLGYKGTESCEVVIDSAVPATTLLGGQEGSGFKQALNVLEHGRINIAARAVGVAQASYEAALAYSQQREAFGQPISEFQAIRLKLADMATDITAGRLLWRWAATRLDAQERADRETGMAKVFCSEVALRASLTSMRVHGGYGYSTEYDVERYYRDAPLMAIGEGTNDVLRLVVARSLLSNDGRSAR